MPGTTLPNKARKGSSASGNYGHSGRQGKVGGSAVGSGGALGLNVPPGTAVSRSGPAVHPVQHVTPGVYSVSQSFNNKQQALRHAMRQNQAVGARQTVVARVNGQYHAIDTTSLQPTTPATPASAPTTGPWPQYDPTKHTAVPGVSSGFTAPGAASAVSLAANKAHQAHGYPAMHTIAVVPPATPGGPTTYKAVMVNGLNMYSPSVVAAGYDTPQAAQKIMQRLQAGNITASTMSGQATNTNTLQVVPVAGGKFGVQDTSKVPAPSPTPAAIAQQTRSTPSQSTPSPVATASSGFQSVATAGNINSARAKAAKLGPGHQVSRINGQYHVVKTTTAPAPTPVQPTPPPTPASPAAPPAPPPGLPKSPIKGVHRSPTNMQVTGVLGSSMPSQFTALYHSSNGAAAQRHLSSMPNNGAGHTIIRGQDGKHYIVKTPAPAPAAPGSPVVLPPSMMRAPGTPGTTFDDGIRMAKHASTQVFDAAERMANGSYSAQDMATLKAHMDSFATTKAGAKVEAAAQARKDVRGARGIPHKDNVLSQVYEEQGFHAKPHLVKDGQMNQYLNRGELQGFRSVNDGTLSNGKAVRATDIHDHLKKGDVHFAAHGIYGNGTYVATVTPNYRSHNTATARADSAGYGNTQIHMTIKPGAKLIEYSKLQRIQNELRKEYQTDRYGSLPYTAVGSILQDEGRLAAWLGYDGIHAVRGSQSTYLNMHNRTALRIEDTTYNGASDPLH